jgi:hypothetical protein
VTGAQSETSELCVRYDSIFGKVWGWVKKHVKKIVASAVLGAATVVIGGITLVSTLGCEAATDGVETLECYKIAAFGTPFTLAAGRATVAAWQDEP